MHDLHLKDMPKQSNAPISRFALISPKSEIKRSEIAKEHFASMLTSALIAKSTDFGELSVAAHSCHNN